MLCNTLVIKNIILDYQIWYRVSEEIQEGLYRWVKDVVMQGPSVLAMESMPRSAEFSRVTGLQAYGSQYSNNNKFTAMNKRKWNSQRMRDLEIMDDILTILVNPKVPIMTRKALFSLTQRLLMENFGYEEAESMHVMHKLFVQIK